MQAELQNKGLENYEDFLSFGTSENNLPNVTLKHLNIDASKQDEESSKRNLLADFQSIKNALPQNKRSFWQIFRGETKLKIESDQNKFGVKDLGNLASAPTDQKKLEYKQSRFRKSTVAVGTTVVTAVAVLAAIFLAGPIAVVALGALFIGGGVSLGWIAHSRNKNARTAALQKLNQAEEVAAKELGQALAQEIRQTALNRDEGGKLRNIDQLNKVSGLLDVVTTDNPEPTFKQLKTQVKTALKNNDSTLSDETHEVVNSWSATRRFFYSKAEINLADKTLDTFAEEIAKGILHGVYAAYAESALHDLADKVSIDVQTENVEGCKPYIDNFKTYTKHLYPSAPANNQSEPSDAHFSDEHLKLSRQQLEVGLTYFNSQKDAISNADKTSKDAIDKIIKDFHSDILNHQKSLDHLEDAVLGAEYEGSVDASNVGTSKLADYHFHFAALLSATTPEKVTQCAQKMTDTLDQIATTIASDEFKNSVVEPHAGILEQLQGTLRSGTKDWAARKTTLLKTITELKSTDQTSDIQRLIQTLSDVYQGAKPNPSGRAWYASAMFDDEVKQLVAIHELGTQVCNTKTELNKVEESLSESVQLARKSATYFKNRQTEETPAYVCFQRLCDYHAQIDQSLTAWIDDGYTLPKDVNLRSVDDYKRDITAAYLGITDPDISTGPVLGKLVDRSDLLEKLRPLNTGQSNLDDAAQGTDLSELLKAITVTGTEPENALKSLQNITEHFPALEPDIRMHLLGAIFPDSAEVLKTAIAISGLQRHVAQAQSRHGTTLGRLFTKQDIKNPVAAFMVHLNQFDQLFSAQPKLADLQLPQLSVLFEKNADQPFSAEALEQFDLSKLTSLTQYVETLNEKTSAFTQQLTKAKELAELADVLRHQIQGTSQNIDAALDHANLFTDESARHHINSISNSLFELNSAVEHDNREIRLTTEEYLKTAARLKKTLSFKGAPNVLAERLHNNKTMRKHLEIFFLTASLQTDQNSAHKAVQPHFSPGEFDQGISDLTELNKLPSKNGRILQPDEKLRYKHLLANLNNMKNTPSALQKSSQGLDFMYQQAAYRFISEKNKNEISSTKTSESHQSSITSSYDLRFAYEGWGELAQQVDAKAPFTSGLTMPQYKQDITSYIREPLAKRVRVMDDLIIDGLGSDKHFAKTLQREWVEQIRNLDQLDSFVEDALTEKDPDGTKLIQLGKMIKEAETVAGLTEDALQHKYLMQQAKDTTSALAYLNLGQAELDVPGHVFHQAVTVIKNVFRDPRDQLRKISNSNDAKAITSDMLKVIEGKETSAQLNSDLAAFDKRIKQLEKEKLARLPEDANQKVRAALALAVFEVTAITGNEKIDEATRSQITERWQAMLGGETTASVFDHVSDEFKKCGDAMDVLQKLDLATDTVKLISKRQTELHEAQAQLNNEAVELRKKIAATLITDFETYDVNFVKRAYEIEINEKDLGMLKSAFLNDPANNAEAAALALQKCLNNLSVAKANSMDKRQGHFFTDNINTDHVYEGSDLDACMVELHTDSTTVDLYAEQDEKHLFKFVLFKNGLGTGDHERIPHEDMTAINRHEYLAPIKGGVNATIEEFSDDEDLRSAVIEPSGGADGNGFGNTDYTDIDEYLNSQTTGGVPPGNNQGKAAGARSKARQENSSKATGGSPVEKKTQTTWLERLFGNKNR